MSIRNNDDFIRERAQLIRTISKYGSRIQSAPSTSNLRFTG